MKCKCAGFKKKQEQKNKINWQKQHQWQHLNTETSATTPEAEELTKKLKELTILFSQ